MTNLGNRDRIVPSEESGGTHTSRTIMLPELSRLMAACPATAGIDDYGAAILNDNVLLKRSESGRRRSLRYLRELYVLDSRSVLFRGLRDLWYVDDQAHPLLALECAVARDPLLRATSKVVLSSPAGTELTGRDLAQAVSQAFPDRYNEAVLNKIGRNAASSWTQSGHLKGRSRKVRATATCTSAAVAYALMLGHLDDARGLGLLTTVWGQALDTTDHVILDQAQDASRRGWIDLRRAGNVIDVGFSWLLRSGED